MAWSSHRHAGDAPPVGRDAEAARLTNLIDDAAAGAKRAALLLGVPGIGKSTLLRFARAYAGTHGIVSSYVRVPGSAGLPPRFPLGELLGGFLATFSSHDLAPPERLTRVVATLTGQSSVDEYAVSLPQIADALEEAGRLGPLGLFVDDYDWAPPEGTELLIAALRVIETPLCFVATARLRATGDEPPSPLPAPTADLWVDQIEVRGLDPRAVAELAAAELGHEILPSLADALFARTLGNPLFVSETLQAWIDQEAVVPTGGFLGIDPESDPADARSLREMISFRLSRLNEDALSAAGCLAVIGREASIEEIARVGGATPASLVEPLSVLEAEGFVTGEGQEAPRFRIAHPLHAVSVLDHLGSTSVATIHGEICAALQERAATGSRVSASELAHHAVRALDPPRELRALLAAAAAEAADAGSNEEASVWFGHLAELADDPSELIRALTGQATSKIHSDPAQAVQLFTFALDLEPNPAARAGLLLGRARSHRVAGLFDPALADLEDALPLADPADAFDVRHAIGALHGLRGKLDEAESVFRSLAQESENAPQHWKAVGHLGMVAFVRGDAIEGARLHEEAFKNNDDPEYSLYLQTNLAWMLVLVGRWDEADVHLQSAMDSVIAAGNIHDEITLACIGSRLAAWRGELASSFDYAQRAIRLATRLGNPADLINAHDALASALLENEMPGEAVSILSKVLTLDGPDLEPREYSYTYVVLGEAALDVGDLGLARTAIDRARHHLTNAIFWRIAVDRLHAQVELRIGDASSGLDLLRPWLDTPSPIAFEQARVLDVAAEALFAIGDRSSAVSCAQEALRIYERLGANRRATHLGKWLVEHTNRGRGRPRSTLPGHLTHRETEILRLVVLGCSNRQVADELFISLGTAKKHVENIMAKAGVSRRTELVPFAVGIGALALEDLRAEPGTRRVVRIDRLEHSKTAPAD
jgi:DNA-binding CsgD family transcriptional regulator